MIATEIRTGQLRRLSETLHDIMRIIGSDPTCRWREHFEAATTRADSLLARGFTQEQLTDLASFVCSVYDVRRRLPQYSPPAQVRDADNFPTYASVAYERALELRAIGHIKA